MRQPDSVDHLLRRHLESALGPSGQELAKIELHGNRTDEDIAKPRDLD